MIWLTQCLCEKRHCILAGAWDDTEVSTLEGIASVQNQVQAMIEARQIDPCCRICRSSKFHYETGAHAMSNIAAGATSSTGTAATKH